MDQMDIVKTPLFYFAMIELKGKNDKNPERGALALEREIPPANPYKHLHEIAAKYPDIRINGFTSSKTGLLIEGTLGEIITDSYIERIANALMGKQQLLNRIMLTSNAPPVTYPMALFYVQQMLSFEILPQLAKTEGKHFLGYGKDAVGVAKLDHDEFKLSDSRGQNGTFCISNYQVTSRHERAGTLYRVETLELKLIKIVDGHGFGEFNRFF
jgi:hypothetical protein